MEGGVIRPERRGDEVGVGKEWHLEDLGEDGLDAVRVRAALGRDAQQPLRAEDDARFTILLGAAAPRDELSAK